MTDRLPQVLEEAIRVRTEMGWPIMATPFSQLVGIQALMNVVQGERYRTIPDENLMYLAGWYGKPPGAVDPEVLERAAATGFVTGRTRGLAAIFPRGDLTLWERLHNEDRVMSIYADLAASALHAAVRPGMRVLEVGGGVGSVLARCASPLEAAGIGEYWFTDVGRTFVEAARDRHKDIPWLRFAQLDVDRRLEQHFGLQAPLL